MRFSPLSCMPFFPSPQKMAFTSPPQLTSRPPMPWFRIPPGHSRMPLNFTQRAPAQESSTHWNKNLWQKMAAVFLEGLPCASPALVTFSLALLLMPDTKATSTTVNFFQGSRHWLSLPLQCTLKVEIFFMSSKSQTKLNHFAWTGQLANCEYLPLYFIVTCPCATKAFVLIKAEMVQWYHMLNIWGYIYKKNNFCLHNNKKHPQFRAHNSSSRYVCKTPRVSENRGDTECRRRSIRIFPVNHSIYHILCEKDFFNK